MIELAERSLEFVEESKVTYQQALDSMENFDVMKYTERLFETCYLSACAVLCFSRKKSEFSYAEVKDYLKQDLVSKGFMPATVLNFFELIGSNVGKYPAEQEDDRFCELNNIDRVNDMCLKFMTVTYGLLESLSPEQ